MLGAILARRKARMGSSFLNSREIDEFLKDWRDDAVFIYPGSTSVSGEHKGKGSIRRWWMTFYEQFPESHFTIKGIYIRNIMSFLPSNQMAVEWQVDLKNIHRNRFHNHGVSIVSIRNGKITRFEDYIFDQETLGKAWSSNPPDSAGG